MTDSTKNLFDAPWEKSFQDWESYKEITIYDSKNQPVCLTRNKEMSNRLANLPELYEALFDSVLRICSTCIGSNLSDTPLDDVGRCCRANCPVHKYTALLKKVRDGE